MDEIIQLFEECEDFRHKSAIKSNLEFFDPPRGKNNFRFHHELFLKKLENHQFGETTPTGENLDAMITNNLSTDEASSIYMYTHHNIYKNINYLLRSNIKLHKDENAYIKLLNKGLDKLNSTNNAILYRDISQPENGVEFALDFYESKLNSVVQFNDYLSCHKDNRRISDEETDFQFVISTSSNSNAKDIQNITFIQIELEVLFKNGTKFKIDVVDRTQNQIHITEI
ncbi:ADP-ribosyltransferase exoenzyme [Maribacter caenipelagi]|uniref:ADP-ribosyltransferase exoenzyme n=1 Tax=Maribacter caenipelagi TaxID=1447781 RepID=A0A4R7CU01_9FLAO|nr:ADP-ribosyltransferase [Maribacter caenipelagi]TDS10925.1 ADP-ribosyltransferase exoenzyme [Maribacter caenipelagi]